VHLGEEEAGLGPHGALRRGVPVEVRVVLLVVDAAVHLAGAGHRPPPRQHAPHKPCSVVTKRDRQGRCENTTIRDRR